MGDILDFEHQLLAWNTFIDRQELLPTVNQLVAKSWKRCRGRQNPAKAKPPKRLSNEHLLSSQVAGFALLSISRPVMEDIYQYIECSASVVVLVNRAGYILEILGDPEMLEFSERLGISPGASVSESEMGTNAFGLSLLEGVPARVVGAEHYLSRFHELAEAAAPIFDPIGRALGALGLITPAYEHHAHTLGIAVAGARAIERQRQSDQLLDEQNSRLKQLKTILAANSDGMVVWSADRVVMHINPAAVKILGISEQAVLGRYIHEFITYPKFLRQAVDERKPITDAEININVDGRSISCIISIRYVLNNDELQWIVCTFRQEKDVRRLVHSQVGAYATSKLEDIPGESQEIRRVRRFIRAAAQANTCILIRGEIGTGKNQVASAIHNLSPNRDGPFLMFACSSFLSELAVSELSGVEEGVSSKLPGGRPSKFELTNNGSLFLQDVDALPLEAQGILLNYIDWGVVQRLGSTRPIPVNVRIITSSSVDMEKLISQGNFRSDLFYRFSSLEITMPPLRNRLEDLPVLLERIVRHLSRALDRQIELEPGVVKVLKNYSWPGNIRELEAVLGRAAMQAGFSGVIAPAHLPDYVLYPVKSSDGTISQSSLQSLDELEREAILKAAELCQGNASEMARMLGVGRTTIWRRLKSLGVSLDQYRRN
jgi:PAS domain S-box-containing protein